MLDVSLTVACVVLLIVLLYAAHEVSITQRPFYYVAVNVLNLLVGAIALSPWGVFGLPPTGWPACVLLIVLALTAIVRRRAVGHWILSNLGSGEAPPAPPHPLRRSTDWGSLSPAPTRGRG